MNLSGKKTRIGRYSGERCILRLPKGKALDVTNVNLSCNFQVQGQRISFLGFVCLFLCLLEERLSLHTFKVVKIKEVKHE